MKKFLAIALLIVFVLSALCACTDNGTAETGANTDGQSGVTSAPSALTTSPVTTEGGLVVGVDSEGSSFSEIHPAG